MRVEDGHGGVDLGTVTMTVSSANAAPECSATEITVTSGTTGSVSPFYCPDADFDPLTYTLGDPPAHGDVLGPEVPGGTYGWKFAADAGYTGADSFTVLVSDGEATGVLTVNVTITAYKPPTLPVCQSVSLTTPVCQSIRVPLDCIDSEGRYPFPEILEPPAPETGSLDIISLNPPSVVFTPAAGFTGLARFTFRGRDSDGDSEPATAEIRVGDAPVVTSRADPTPVVAAADLAAPLLAISPLRRQKAKSLKSGVAFDAVLDEPAALAVKLTVSKAAARRLKLRKRTIGSATRQLGAGKTRVRVKVTKRARRALGRAKRSTRIDVSAVATDAAGNRRVLSSRVTVRR